MQIEHKIIEKLIQQAFEARERSYCPYSKFAVGAALLTPSGQIYTGCNIENAAYSPSNCAERTAFFKAVSEGIREFSAMAVVGGKQPLKIGSVDFCSPCGVCRQVMLEFCKEDFSVILASDLAHYKIYKLKELVPYSFSSKDL